MIQFMFLQALGLALVMIFPQLVLWLPGVLYTN
jgi:TRAP-type mannitol/chloroaromatic compound transport system permease large subunit